jgi:hypothetical protein
MLKFCKLGLLNFVRNRFHLTGPLHSVEGTASLSLVSRHISEFLPRTSTFFILVPIGTSSGYQ